MRRRRRSWPVVAILAATLALAGCADPDAAPGADPAAVPAAPRRGPEVDPGTARVVGVYVAMLGHLVREGGHGGPGSRVLYLVDHAVPELHETGIPEEEKRTPAPASTSTARFTAPVRRCLEGARFDGLPPITLVEGYDDPTVRTAPVAAPGWPAGPPRPRRIVDGRLFSLGGVPAEGGRLALAASSLGGDNDATGGLFVLRREAGAWRVTGQARHWVT